MITTEARNTDLGPLVELLKAQQAAKLDAVVPAQCITSAGGVLSVAGMGLDGPVGAPGRFAPTRGMLGQIADKLDVPLAYLRRLHESRPDIFDANVNGWLQGGYVEDGERVAWGPDPRSFLVRSFIDTEGGLGVGRSLLSDRFNTGLDHLDMTFALLEGIRDAGVETEVVGCDLSETRMSIKIAAPAVRALVPGLLAGYRSPLAGRTTPQWAKDLGISAEEPVAFAGFVATNGETGGTSFSVAPRIVLFTCWNGNVITKDMLRKVHLGGQLDSGVVRWSGPTYEKQQELTRLQVADAVKTFLSPEYVEMTVAGIEETAATPLADPAKAVEIVTKKFGWSEEAQAGILDHFIRGGQVTAGGVLQAVTSFSQTVADPDVAFDLEWKALQAMELVATA